MLPHDGDQVLASAKRTTTSAFRSNFEVVFQGSSPATQALLPSKNLRNGAGSIRRTDRGSKG
jgi:hypothetical protein